MKNIHLAGLGVAGIGMGRCLMVPDITYEDPDYRPRVEGEYKLQGHDQSPWQERIAREEGVATEPDIEEMWQADMIIPTPDALVHKFSGGSKMEGEGSSLCFLPDLKQIELCQDKAKCADVLGDDIAPLTYWVRDTIGAGGKGAQMASEYLPGKNVSVEFAFKDGVRIGRFTKERVSYSLIKKTSGLEERGSSVVSVCVQDEQAEATAQWALESVSAYTATPLNGFYGVDLKGNNSGEYRVTEINAGRLLTASYTYFYKTGYNLALAGVKAFLDEPYEPCDYPLGYGMLRTMDRVPVLCTPEETALWK